MWTTDADVEVPRVECTCVNELKADCASLASETELVEQSVTALDILFASWKLSG